MLEARTPVSTADMCWILGSIIRSAEARADRNVRPTQARNLRPFFGDELFVVSSGEQSAGFSRVTEREFNDPSIVGVLVDFLGSRSKRVIDLGDRAADGRVQIGNGFR